MACGCRCFADGTPSAVSATEDRGVERGSDAHSTSSRSSGDDAYSDEDDDGYDSATESEDGSRTSSTHSEDDADDDDDWRSDDPVTRPGIPVHRRDTEGTDAGAVEPCESVRGGRGRCECALRRRCRGDR